MTRSVITTQSATSSLFESIGTDLPLGSSKEPSLVRIAPLEVTFLGLMLSQTIFFVISTLFVHLFVAAVNVKTEVSVAKYGWSMH